MNLSLKLPMKYNITDDPIVREININVLHFKTKMYSVW